MALNFSGLGFTFGVKDAGLEGFGDKLADGFASLSDRITQSIDLTKKFSPPIRADYRAVAAIFSGVEVSV